MFPAGGDATLYLHFSGYSGSEVETGDGVAICMLDLIAAKTIHYLLVPLAQFALAIFIADTWQYLTHRLVHMNQYLCSEFDRSFGLPTVDKAGGRTYFESANAFLKMSQPISTLSITV